MCAVAPGAPCPCALSSRLLGLQIHRWQVVSCVSRVFSALSTSFFSLRVRMFHTELPSLEFINPFVFSNLLLIHWIIRFSYFSVLVNFLTDVVLRRRSPPGPLYFPPSPLFSWACSWWLLCGLPGASSVWHLGVCFCCFFFSFSVRCA